MQHIEKRMIMEINWGLGRDTNLSSNIKSYITYVSSLPSGREEGEYLALDLGGTNFRSAECQYCQDYGNLDVKQIFFVKKTSGRCHYDL